MKKRITILIIIISLFITGCKYFDLSAEDKEKAKEYEKIAKTLTESYIKEKYNFNAEIKNIEASGERASLSPVWLTGDVYLTMKHNNKIYYVKVKADTKEVIGDTYQNDIIEQGSIKKIKEIFGQDPVFFKSNLGDPEKNLIGHLLYLSYYHDYYGENGKYYFPSFYAGIVNFDSNNDSIIEKLNQMLLDKVDYTNTDMVIINYKSIESYNSTKNQDPSTTADDRDGRYIKGYYQLDTKTGKFKYESIGTN